MNRIIGLLTIAIAVIIMPMSAIGQDSQSHGGKMQVMTFEKGSVHIIDELGAVIVAEDGQLSVQIVNPKAHRSQKYQDVDLRQGDKLLMLNGKKLNSIKDLEDAYGEVKAGGDVKFGIKRENIMMMVSFPKGEPGDHQGTHTMVMKTTGDTPACQSGKKKPGMKVVEFGSSTGEITPVLDAGLILTEANNQVSIMALAPNAGEIYKDKSPQDGDIILSLQDQDVKSPAQFTEVFDNIKVGDQVDLRIVRDGQEMRLTFIKPESTIMKPGSDN
jgi:S1-C subfamily serine protease